MARTKKITLTYECTHTENVEIPFKWISGMKTSLTGEDLAEYRNSVRFCKVCNCDRTVTKAIYTMLSL